MWVVRAGQGAKYFEKFLSEKKIFLSWEGYKKDLKEYTSLKMMREEQENYCYIKKKYLPLFVQHQQTAQKI